VFKYGDLNELVATIEGLWAGHEALEREGTLPLSSSAVAVDRL
jgi:hypothetical protein